MKYFTYTVIGIVVAAIIAGFFIVGSPAEERRRRFDDRRLGDLQFLQSEILNYWQNKNKLPETLGVLEESIKGIALPKDPETTAAYEYQSTGDLSFRLCANFALSNIGGNAPEFARPVSVPGPYYGENWEHKGGYVCFDRNIDPDLYKLKSVK